MADVREMYPVHTMLHREFSAAPDLIRSADRNDATPVSEGSETMAHQQSEKDTPDDLARVGGWVTARTATDFAGLQAELQNFRLLGDPATFWVQQREARLGPITIRELRSGTDMWVDAGQQRSGYYVNVPIEGHLEAVHRGSPIVACPGSAAVYRPQGDTTITRWAAHGRTIVLKIERCAIDDALSEVLGREISSQIDFTPTMPVTTCAARDWTNLVRCFNEQVFRPDSLLSRPIVGLPFVESLVRGLLVAADHPQRVAVETEAPQPAPRTIRTAIEIMEADAHLPLTVTSVAARTHVSVRSLQDGFSRHLGMSPTRYLREIRLRRAHQALLDSDPSTDTVASVARLWGFTNLGRFAAAHAGRYGETPAITLRRTPTRHSPIKPDRHATDTATARH
jgi:AraC-like DNA-binding protein